MMLRHLIGDEIGDILTGGWEALAQFSSSKSKSDN